MQNKAFVTTYINAINANDIEAVMALFSPTATLENSPYRPIQPKIGVDLIREYITETIINQHGKLHLLSVFEHENVVEAKVEVRSKRITQAGFERIIGTEKFNMKNSLIQEFTFEMDLKDGDTLSFLHHVKQLEKNRPEC